MVVAHGGDGAWSDEDTAVIVGHEWLQWDMAVVRYSGTWTSGAKRGSDGHWSSSSDRGIQCESLSGLASGMIGAGSGGSFHSTLPSLQWPHNSKDSPLFVQKHNLLETVMIVCF